MNFKKDLEMLLSNAPEEHWRDKLINGIQYDYYPWHGYSAISLRSLNDKIRDNPADWEKFEVSKSDGTILINEINQYCAN